MGNNSVADLNGDVPGPWGGSPLTWGDPSPGPNLVYAGRGGVFVFLCISCMGVEIPVAPLALAWFVLNQEPSSRALILS